ACWICLRLCSSASAIAPRQRFFWLVVRRANSREAALACLPNCAICSLNVTLGNIRAKTVRAKAGKAALPLANPNQRSNGQPVEQWNQIVSGHVDAAVRVGPSQSSFIAKTVDVNIPVKRIHLATAIELRL